jgi:hypothetical protein
MAVTNQQVLDFLLATPNMSDAQIFAAMRTFGVPPSQMAAVSGVPINAIIARLAPLIPPNEAVLLGDTYVQSIYDVIGSGEDQQLGGLKNILTYKADENKTGGAYNQYLPTGELERAGTQQAVEANKDFLKFLAGSAALFGGAALAGSGGGAATEAALTAGDLAIGAGSPTTTGLLSGGSLTTGLTAADIAAAEAGLTTGTTTAGVTTAANTAANTALTNTAANTALTNTAATTAATTGATTLANTAAATAATAAATGLTTTQVADLVKTGLTTAQIANLFSTGATTAAGLLQQQTSKEAADKARAMIDVETAAAKQAAAFRPVGMTTRFGTSKFGVDPLTGQMTAGYTLSPEAKNAQDRFLTLAGAGLTQAEGAQEKFKPLQTGAESLFTLGNKYLAKTPEDVAKDYLASQMALLKPGREIELANLQNRLQQQGRGGLSVAQGGTMGATTPELQALYNARAQQEAQLAANAQQYGQQQVAFGAGLLGTGAQTMGQYYAGQQAAYAPYTTAFGQMQALESAAQQPLQLGANLGQTAAQAGFNVGQLGLRGAGASVELATGKAATTNPYSTAISGLAANPAFSQYVGGLFSGVPPVTAMSAPATTFGTGNYYGNQDLGLFL